MKKLFQTVVFSLISCIAFCQDIITIAGNGGGITDSGDGGPATNAVTFNPAGLAFDKLSNLYIAESDGGRRVRKLSVTGIISTLAGTGMMGYSGDGGAATNAKLTMPTGVCTDLVGNIYIADQGADCIRKVNVATGIISTIAGNGITGFAGDGGPATNAQLHGPHDICFDKRGNLYIADQYNYRVRKVDLTGVITTVAGRGPAPPYYYSGDGGYADTTAIRSPRGICIDDTGSIYITDGHSRVMIIDTFGFIRTYAGNGVSAVSGENVAATSASTAAIEICTDKENNVYLSEYIGGHRIRKVDVHGIITTIAGTGVAGFSGDGGPATASNLKAPAGVVTDTCGNLYIADSWNNRVRKVLFYPDCPDTSGGEGPTQFISVTTPPTEISVFPNPVSDVLHVTCSAPVAFSIAAISGKEVGSGTLTKGDNSIHVGHFPAGVYFINASSSSGERRVYKVVKE